MKTHFVSAIVAGILLSTGARAAGIESAAATSAGRPVLEWDFGLTNGLRGWQPNGHVQDVQTGNGALRCRTAGSDPILELRPLVDVPATPWQYLEVTMKADRDGEAEWFWSNTAAGRYGGFSQEKTLRFHVSGDKQWHTYRVMPLWHPEKRIVRLRLDLYDGTSFEIGRIRLGEWPMPATASLASFDFAQGSQGWQPREGAELTSDGQGLVLRTPVAGSFALAPPVELDADKECYLGLRLSADGPGSGTLLFATANRSGWQRCRFPIEGPGEVDCHVDLSSVPGWRGRVVALGLRCEGRPGQTTAPAVNARVRWLKVTSQPEGPPALRIASFVLEDALPRAGASLTLRARLVNQGVATASNICVRFELPESFRLAGAGASERRFPILRSEEDLDLSWKVSVEQPFRGQATLRVESANASPQSRQAELDVTARLEGFRGDYPPAPKPVRGPCEVGAYYFPGWKLSSQWQPIQSFPERRPVLGWYREGDPEVADWQIKWAVEHGITFFAYDWYWSQGSRQLEHGLHDGYFKARYRHYLKFCLLWANHNAPRTSSPGDCLAVTRYWIEHYFHRPEHLTIDGKPVVIIFSTDRLTQDLGGDGVKKSLEAMRAECVRAGLKGLCVIACVGDAGQARQAGREGYDAVTCYNWAGLGMAGDDPYAPFATLVSGYRRNWEHIIEVSPVPLVPLPISGGWDSRPWHGDNNLVRFGRTPELFKQHLRDAWKVVSERSAKPGARTQLERGNLVLIEAWNEWGEGSYIEPHKEFGFGYLDAIREVFTRAPSPHDDLTPADLGLGSYDLPPAPAARTAWDFADGDQGWNNTMDLADTKGGGGLLSARTTGNDPAFFGPAMQARATSFTAVLVRMRLRRADGQPLRDRAQLFWRTSRLPESESSSERFEVLGDGQWHDYSIPVSANRLWRGSVTRLRLDPCGQSGVQVEVSSIRLLGR